VARSTFWTRPFPIVQRKCLVLPTADSTQTTARIPPISHDEPRPVALRLVVHLRAEHSKTHVGYGASRPAVRQHSLDVHILDHHRLVFAAKSGCQLVNEVRPDVGDARNDRTAVHGHRGECP